MLCRLKILKRKRMQKGETACFKPGEQIPKKKRHSKKIQSTRGPIGMPACLLVVVIQVDSLTFVQPTCRGCLFASPAWRVPWRKKSLPIRSKLQSLVERCMLRNLEILMVSKISQLLTMTFFRILSQFFNLMSFRSFQ